MTSTSVVPGVQAPPDSPFNPSLWPRTAAPTPALPCRGQPAQAPPAGADGVDSGRAASQWDLDDPYPEEVPAHRA